MGVVWWTCTSRINSFSKEKQEILLMLKNWIRLRPCMLTFLCSREPQPCVQPQHRGARNCFSGAPFRGTHREAGTEMIERLTCSSFTSLLKFQKRLSFPLFFAWSSFGNTVNYHSYTHPTRISHKLVKIYMLREVYMWKYERLRSHSIEVMSMHTNYTRFY